MIQKKICMVGAFGVGKTSLVARFVHSIFSERYHTTLGVKIDRKDVRVDDRDVRLLLWDLAGEDDLLPLRTSYVRGASGCLFVVDATRRETLDTALSIRQRIWEDQSELPAVVALNKCDLCEERELTLDEVATRFGENALLLETSAKSGVGVEEGFARLAECILRAR